MEHQNLNYNEVIVVEGKNDKAKLSAIFPNLTIVTTNGSEISEETLLLLEKMAKSREIILFLDPDYPGERIRSIITNRIPNAKQAFMPKKLAIDERKHKVGTCKTYYIFCFNINWVNRFCGSRNANFY